MYIKMLLQKGRREERSQLFLGAVDEPKSMGRLSIEESIKDIGVLSKRGFPHHVYIHTGCARSRR